LRELGLTEGGDSGPEGEDDKARRGGMAEG